MFMKKMWKGVGGKQGRFCGVSAGNVGLGVAHARGAGDEPKS